MKNRFLPFGFFVLFLGFSFLLLSQNSLAGNPEKKNTLTGVKTSVNPSLEYLSMLRNNQVTRNLEPADIVKALNQVEKMKYKSGSMNLNWIQAGPNNVAGRTRALIFDNRDQSGITIFAAGVSGGIWKSTNLGLTWHEANTENDDVLKVTCMVQASNGTIYIGTGETFCVQDFTGLKDFKYTSGFMGSGIYSSVDGITFNLLPATQPGLNNANADFAFVNDLALDPRNNRLFAATNTGIKYSDDGATWYSALNGFAYDVKVGPDGTILAQAGDSIYIARDGDVNAFINLSTGSETGLPNTDVGRTEFAIAPSNPNILYASIAKKSSGSLLNVYRSGDKGLTWSVIFPGNDSYEPFNRQGCYDNTIMVFPNDSNQVLLGGRDMWIGRKYESTGYYAWEQISFGDVSPLDPTYVPYANHIYAFQPGNPAVLLIGNDGGVTVGYLSTQGNQFQTRIKNYMVSQFYTVGISNEKNVVIGGAQGNGIQFIDGKENSYIAAKQLWDQAGGGTYNGNGGYAAISLINPNAIVYTKAGGEIRSTEDRGETYSLKFPGDPITNDVNFIAPFTLWESFDFENSRDSITYLAKDSTIYAGQSILVNSANNKFPFYYTVPVTVPRGDSIRIQDIVQTRFFMYCKKSGSVGLYMTKELIKFTIDPEWFKIANITDTVISMAVTKDLNYMYAGTKAGTLYRISNLALAYNYATADINSPQCIVATEVVRKFTGRAVTSVSFASDDDNRLIVTLGNYGNSDYIYLTTNALDSLPTFTNVQGNLPNMPIYSSLIELHDKNRVLVGTDYGVFSTDNISAASPVWTPDYAGIGSVPVFMLTQQRIFQPNFTVPGFSYPGVYNYGVIYAASYGRGLFMDTTYFEPMGIPPAPGTTVTLNQIKIYPNPVNGSATVNFRLAKAENVTFTVFDLNGKQVRTISSGNLSAGEHNQIIDFTGLPAGTYLVRLNSSGGNAFGKVMIAK